jgi:predicted transposase/invertase (TIGR01784 family)
LGNLETDRKAIFDIFCKTESGEYFIVEMQKAKRTFFKDRSIYYATLPIQKQALKGIWDFNLKSVYLVAVLDFVLFDEFEEDKEYVVEYVCLMRERTKTPYSNKLKFAFVELPKFRKTEEELETNFDKWLYSIKNLSKLKARPAMIEGKIFEKLYELSEIKRLTEKDMREYRRSTFKYQNDLRNMVNYARDEGREQGIGIGIEEGIEKGKIDVIQKCLQMDIPIEIIVRLTGYSKEQIIHYRMANTPKD